MSVYETSRKPNFYKDIETYGKIGERFFYNSVAPSAESRGWKICDVSGRPFWQKIDVDFVISKDGKEVKDSFDTVTDPSFTPVEIKIDTRAANTGNLPFEVISHGNYGWSLNTHASRVYVILCRDGIQDGKIYAYKYLLIDMHMWKSAAAYSSNIFKLNRIANEEIYDFLFKIDDMKKMGIILAESEINDWI